MALIHVPRPPKSAYNPDRPVTSLLKSQVEHLHEAERKLPLLYHTDIYVNAIKTEGEASRYIREVTEAIHAAHRDAERARRPRGLEIAAVADERAGRRQAKKKSQTRAKKRSAKSVRLKRKR